MHDRPRGGGEERRRGQAADARRLEGRQTREGVEGADGGEEGQVEGAAGQRGGARRTRRIRLDVRRQRGQAGGDLGVAGQRRPLRFSVPFALVVGIEQREAERRGGQRGEEPREDAEAVGAEARGQARASGEEAMEGSVQQGRTANDDGAEGGEAVRAQALGEQTADLARVSRGTRVRTCLQSLRQQNAGTAAVVSRATAEAISGLSPHYMPGTASCRRGPGQ